MKTETDMAVCLCIEIFVFLYFFVILSLVVSRCKLTSGVLKTIGAFCLSTIFEIAAGSGLPLLSVRPAVTFPAS